LTPRTITKQVFVFRKRKKERKLKVVKDGKPEDIFGGSQEFSGNFRRIHSRFG